MNIYEVKKAYISNIHWRFKFAWCIFNNSIIFPVPKFIEQFGVLVIPISDLNISLDNLYNITNVSSGEDAYILIFDENYVIMQSLRLSPSIKSFNLIPLIPKYKLVVLGKTEIYISPREVK